MSSRRDLFSSNRKGTEQSHSREASFDQHGVNEASGVIHILVRIVQVFPLKGDRISAQGFNPGLGNSRPGAPKGHQIPRRHL